MEGLIVLLYDRFDSGVFKPDLENIFIALGGESLGGVNTSLGKIGRASCRERV